jgi:aryl-alcohol dehydrogenase-like predicted oxidoreductase
MSLVDAALEGGINFFDTAENYAKGEAEAILGRALSGVERSQVVISTKLWPPAERLERRKLRKFIVAGCESSLRRLKTDYVDLFQLHRVFPGRLEDALDALTTLVETGRARFVGSSVHPAWQLMESLLLAERRGGVAFASEQPPYHLLDRRVENELLPMCLAHGLAVIPWSPTAMGLLAGRYQDAAHFPPNSRATLDPLYGARVTPKAVAVAKQFAVLANQCGFSPAQLAVLWVKEQPGVTTPIIGPRTLAQLEELLAIAERGLADEIRAACDDLVPPGSAVTDFYNNSGWMRLQVDGGW